MSRSCRSDLELVCASRRGDDAAREELIVRHAGLARAIARGYAGRGMAHDDILQSGYIGLIHAVDRYDPARGVPLDAYAGRMIEGEIMHLFRDRGWSVRVPRSLQERSRQVARESDGLSHRLGRSPTPAELGEHMGLDVASVEEALQARAAYSAGSIQEQSDDRDDSSPRCSRLARALAGPDERYGQVEDRAQLEWALRHLPHRERTVVALRFFDGLTQSEIALRMGISQMHVSRLLRTSLEVLRERLGGDAATA
jgi:RNA polymerase sigma-B factor